MPTADCGLQSPDCTSPTPRSGSTGRPKGMATTMWRMAHWVRWRAFHWPLGRLGGRVAMGLFLPWYW